MELNLSLETETVFDLPANISINISENGGFVEPPDQKIFDFQAAQTLDSTSMIFEENPMSNEEPPLITDCNTGFAKQNLVLNGDFVPVHEVNLHKILQPTLMVESVEKHTYTDQVEMNYNSIDMILETEKQNNKLDTWNKLDKTGKIFKLHAFAEKYGKTNNMPAKEIKIMKLFFIECLEKMKLQKAKDVVYNKESGEITSIPSLYFNTTNHKFTLKIMDAKRVSTLKCLTPKRISEKIRENIDTKN